MRLVLLDQSEEFGDISRNFTRSIDDIMVERNVIVRAYSQRCESVSSLPARTFSNESGRRHEFPSSFRA